LLGNEEPVLTAHRFVFDIGFLQLAGSGCASMLTAAESELLKCWCSYVTLDTTEPLTHAIRGEPRLCPIRPIIDFFGMRLTQIELAYLGGAAMRVGAAETAFGHRSSPFVISLLV
jgi:hypothetical protein